MILVQIYILERVAFPVLLGFGADAISVAKFGRVILARNIGYVTVGLVNWVKLAFLIKLELICYS